MFSERSFPPGNLVKIEDPDSVALGVRGPECHSRHCWIFCLSIAPIFQIQFQTRIYHHQPETFEVLLFRKLHGWPENDFLLALETTHHWSGMGFSGMFSPQLFAGTVPCCIWHLLWRTRIPVSACCSVPLCASDVSLLSKTVSVACLISLPGTCFPVSGLPAPSLPPGPI